MSRLIGTRRALYRAPAVVEAGPTYEGPGDIAPGATAWWGLRAYSAATLGDALVRIKRSSDNAQADIPSDTTTGILDVAHSHFNGSTTYTIMKWYDQVGSADIDVQVDGSTLLLLNDNGSLPAGHVNDSYMRSTAFVPVMTQPVSTAVVARRTGVDSERNAVVAIFDGASAYTFGFYVTTGTIELIDFNTGNITASGATEGNTHALASLINGATSKICINGTTTNGNFPTTANVGDGTADRYYFPSRLSDYWEGKVWEAGWWDADISASFADLSTNQHTIWDF